MPPTESSGPLVAEDEVPDPARRSTAPSGEGHALGDLAKYQPDGPGPKCLDELCVCQVTKSPCLGEPGFVNDLQRLARPFFPSLLMTSRRTTLAREDFVRVTDMETSMRVVPDGHATGLVTWHSSATAEGLDQA